MASVKRARRYFTKDQVLDIINNSDPDYNPESDEADSEYSSQSILKHLKVTQPYFISFFISESLKYNISVKNLS